MPDETSNDNDAVRADRPSGSPDPHGQAAMLLVESLIHGLIARSVISIEDAVEIVNVAAEVKEDVAADLGDTAATMQRSLAILGAIGVSLIGDLPGA